VALLMLIKIEHVGDVFRNCACADGVLCFDTPAESLSEQLIERA
jgi:hypothetical protein